MNKDPKMSKYPLGHHNYSHELVSNTIFVEGIRFGFQKKGDQTFHYVARDRNLGYEQKVEGLNNITVKIVGWEAIEDALPEQPLYLGGSRLRDLLNSRPGRTFNHYYYSRREPTIPAPFDAKGRSARLTYEIWVDGVLDGTYSAAHNPVLEGEVLSLKEGQVTLRTSPHFGGQTLVFPLSEQQVSEEYEFSYYVPFLALYIAENCKCTPEQQVLLAWSALRPKVAENPDTKGLHKHKGLMLEMSKDPLLDSFLSRFCSSGSVQKVIANRLLGAFFDALGGDIPAIKKTLFEKTHEYLRARVSYRGASVSDTEHLKLLQALPGASDKVLDEEKKRDWKKRDSLREQAEGLLPDRAQTPLLFEALQGGCIPFGVFNQPSRGGVEGAPVNREFELWEEALARPGWADVIYEVSKNAAARTTYERDITSWLSFMLYTLPEYLNKHAPRPRGATWTCKPKFVSSSWELEMAEADENGTTKRRSAMTPVADNETGIVEVPYVAVATHGDRTTWCYSKNYHIFTRGFYDSISNSTVTRDVEVGLNGRDDYGLCFYTLNGSATAQGYPTFLIIFERKSKETVVHFHRVRPCRSKEGIWTPANQLVAACYQYMAGNVPASEIVTQQGDLMLLRYSGHAEGDTKNPLKKGAKVKGDEAKTGTRFVYESHEFVGPLTFYPSDTKSVPNRLGFVHAPLGLQLLHPEHENTPRLAGGWFEVRRAKSYENNPRVSATFFND